MTILIFLIVLVVLILSHEIGHAVAAKLLGCRVEEFGLGFPPRIFGKKIGETLFSLNLVPLGGFVKITGEDLQEMSEATADKKSFANKNWVAKLVILLAGVFMNIVLAIVLFSMIAGVGTRIPTSNAVGIADTSKSVVEVVDVAKNDVLKSVDIKVGDDILKINGKKVSTAEEAASEIRNYTGSKLVFEISREGKVGNREIIFSEPHVAGKPVGLGLVDLVNYKVAWWEAPMEGVKSTWRTVKLTANGLGMILSNLFVQHKVPSDVAGPVGIAQIVGTVGRQGFMPLIELTAVLSVNLALINVLPIPALDGGRVLFVIIEALGFKFFRGKKEQLAHTIGFIALIILILLITINDIRRIFQ